MARPLARLQELQLLTELSSQVRARARGGRALLHRARRAPRCRRPGGPLPAAAGGARAHRCFGSSGIEAPNISGIKRVNGSTTRLRPGGRARRWARCCWPSPCRPRGASSTTSPRIRKGEPCALRSALQAILSYCVLFFCDRYLPSDTRPSFLCCVRSLLKVWPRLAVCTESYLTARASHLHPVTSATG